MYEKALREKFRFPSVKGELTTEQLWDLPLTSRNGFDLDNVAQAVDAQLKEASQGSFVSPNAGNAKRKRLEEQLSIVVHVIGIKQAEAEQAKTAIERREKKRQLTEILHIRTQQDLMSKSPDEIKAMLAELDKADDASAPTEGE